MTQSNGGGAAGPVNEVGLYERMLLIRRVEERLAKEFHAGNLPGAVHLYIGQ